jgi:hypothetical protein
MVGLPGSQGRKFVISGSLVRFPSVPDLTAPHSQITLGAADDRRGIHGVDIPKSFSRAVRS